MDGIWDPPYYQANEDTIPFCHPYDAIEETNINVECCIQVLEMWIRKADTDIVEHEEELRELLCQFACTDEVFSDMFSMSLRAKIDFLDSSIRKLKDDDENFLSTSREPAESIYDILKSLFCRYLQKKDLQFADNTGTASSSNCQVPADNQKQQIGSFSNAKQVEKIRTVNITTVEKQIISPIVVKVEEENTNFSHRSPVPKYPPHSLYRGITKKTDREVSKFQIKNPTITKKNIPRIKTPRSNSVCSKPYLEYLETQGNCKHQLNVIKSQLADNTGTASSSNCQVLADSQKKQVGSSNTNQLEQIKTVNIIPAKKQIISTILVKVEEENTNYSHASPVSKYARRSLCQGSTKKTDREVSKHQIKSPIIMKTDILQNTTPRSNFVCSNLETQGKRKHQLIVVKSQAYDESMSLATVPYVESSEEASAMSLATIPFVESHEEADAKQIIVKELDFPPGYPHPQHQQEQSPSGSQSAYSTRTYTRRKKSNTTLHTSSSPQCLALVMANPLDESETHSNLLVEDYYTVNDLRAIAKQKIKGYYKLRKAELAHALGIKLIKGRRKQPKKRETQLVPMIKCEP